MAQVFPQWLPDQERNNPGRRAEILLYDKLAEQLKDDKWVVLYGAAIKWRHDDGVSDRETEFIVAHPDLGIVFIEVKGGSIRRDGNVWYTTPIRELNKPESQRQYHPLRKSPYAQVTDSAKDYERKIQSYIALHRLPIGSLRFGTAVCFPDIEISGNENLGADALLELTLDRSDLENLEGRLCQILQIYRGKSGSGPGAEGIRVLQQIFARDWNIDSYLGYQIQDAEKKRRQLTEEQFQFLYDMQDNPKLLIRGCAGSGKTMLAAKKAHQLASLGQKVLLVCFNENLAIWLRTSDFMHSNILATHFHGFAYQITEDAKVGKLSRRAEDAAVDEDTYFKKLMPEALELAALEQDICFDAIIVDEGQDFERSWLKALNSLLKDAENGLFYIFYDDNQRIYNGENIPYKWPKVCLSRNMRNTDQIFSYVKRYYHQPENIKSSGITGPAPWFVDLSKFENEHDAVQSILSQLVSEKIRLPEVAVLTPRSKENSIWAQQKFVGEKYKLIWTLEPLRGQVTCCSIYAFKGLEKQVIILSELDHLYPRLVQELLYIGISRARNYLIVLGKLPA